MKKIFTILLTLLFTVSTVKADDISADQALTIASQFATASQPSLSKARGHHAIRQALQQKGFLTEYEIIGHYQSRDLRVI